MLYRPPDKIHRDISVCIPSIYEDQTVLIQCLTAILMGTELPGCIHINLNQNQTKFDNFYLTRILEVARYNNIPVYLHVTQKESVQAARQFLTDICTTDYMWFVDDDILLEHNTLEWLVKVREAIFESGGATLDNFAYLNGVHPDLVNDREYSDYDASEKDYATDPIKWLFWFYKHPGVPVWGRCRFPGCGNNLIYLPNLHKSEWKWYTDAYNRSGGEDCLFGLHMYSNGYKGFMTPCAQSIHLGKPHKSNFSNQDAILAAFIAESTQRGYKIDEFKECVKNKYENIRKT